MAKTNIKVVFGLQERIKEWMNGLLFDLPMEWTSTEILSDDSISNLLCIHCDFSANHVRMNNPFQYHSN